MMKIERRECTIRYRAVFAMNPHNLVERIFDHEMSTELEELVDIDASHVITDLRPSSLAVLREAELVIAGWGAPMISVDDAPELRAVVYAGGVASTCLNDAAQWAARGLRASNARGENAVPVAEYALAMILLAGKDAFGAAERFRRERIVPGRENDPPNVGNLGRTIGLVGFSQVAQELIRLLRPFRFDVVVYSPELTDDVARRWGVRRGELDEVFDVSDVVSLHQPLIAATRGQVDAALLARMPDGATLINTARGGVVDGASLQAELVSGRIRAVLDVTDPEPLPADDPLWDLPNVVLTPHLAGSMGSELHRLGEACVAEVRRFVAGEPFAHEEDLTR